MTPCAILLQGFQGTQRLIDSWVSLKSLLLFIGMALLLSFFLGSAKEGVAAYIKSTLTIHQTTGQYSFDARRSRLRSLLLIISIAALTLFLSLGVQQILNCSLKGPGGWATITLRIISLRSILISLCCILVYIAAKSAAIFLYSSVHFRREYRLSNIDCFISYLIVDALLLIPLLFWNEVMPLNGQTTFWVATGIWLFVKAWSTLHIYVIFSSRGVTFVQFLLYFCSFEILPLPVFCKCLFLLG